MDLEEVNTTMTEPTTTTYYKLCYDGDLYDAAFELPEVITKSNYFILTVEGSFVWTIGHKDYSTKHLKSKFDDNALDELRKEGFNATKIIEERVVQNNPTVRYTKTIYKVDDVPLCTKYEFHQDIILM